MISKHGSCPLKLEVFRIGTTWQGMDRSCLCRKAEKTFNLAHNTSQCFRFHLQHVCCLTDLPKEFSSEANRGSYCAGVGKVLVAETGMQPLPNARSRRSILGTSDLLDPAEIGRKLRSVSLIADRPEIPEPLESDFALPNTYLFFLCITNNQAAVLYLPAKLRSSSIRNAFVPRRASSLHHPQQQLEPANVASSTEES